MRYFIHRLSLMVVILISVWMIPALANNPAGVQILVYHNFNPTIPGSMSLTPERFETQVKWLKDNGYTIIPLKDAVTFLQGKEIQLPEKSVVITADDGWKSVYTYMWPIVRKYKIPVTLFIYPETISHGSNAMTWEQLKELQKTGLFDIQSHTYWHPNFKQEKKRLSAEKFDTFVQKQLVISKKILEEKLNTKITLLAWPFGIYNEYLEQQAKNAGYVMAFSIDARPASPSDNPMSQPRYMIIADQNMKMFAGIMHQKPRNNKK